MPEVQMVFQCALTELVTSTGAERAVILFSETDRDLKVRASHGIAADRFWELAPLSLELLRRVQKSGEPLEIEDVSGNHAFKENLSLMLTDIRSLVCAPFWGPRGCISGLVYADWNQARITRDQPLTKAQKVARKVESFLQQVSLGGVQIPNPFLSAPVVPAAARPAPLPSRSRKTFRSPRPQSLPVFFRSLATLFSSGVTLHASLFVLSRNQPDKALQAVAEELGRQLERGQSLSAAMDQVGVFPAFQVRLVEVGERSGRMLDCLARMADLAENQSRRQQKLTSALTYPTFVLLFCLAFLVLVPSTLMSNQIKMLADLKVEQPASMVMLARLVQWLAWWPTWLALALPLLHPGLRGFLKRSMGRLLLRWGPAARVWQALITAEFTQMMAVQLDSGLGVADSLRLAARTTHEPELSERCEQLAEALVQGEELSSCLIRGPFPRLLGEMVRAGEESGQVPRMLDWSARHFEELYTDSIERCLSLVEPLVVMTLGLVCGATILITRLPMVKVLQSL